MNKSIKLNLGCWKAIKKDYINIDIVKYKGVDLVLDLEKDKLPFKDNSVDEIEAFNIFEHLENLDNIMSECYRVLKKNGFINITSPHFSSVQYYIDPTHKKPFSVQTFKYYTKDTPMDYGQAKFGEISTEVLFEKRPALFWNYLIEPMVNFLSSWTQDFWERSFLRGLFPAHHLEIIMSKKRMFK